MNMRNMLCHWCWHARNGKVSIRVYILWLTNSNWREVFICGKIFPLLLFINVFYVFIEIIVHILWIISFSKHFTEFCKRNFAAILIVVLKLLLIMNFHQLALNLQIFFLFFNIIIHSYLHFLSWYKTDEIFSLLITDIFSIQFFNASW